MPDASLPYRYLGYRIRARHRTGRGVHSPFAYHFIKQVFFGDAVAGLEIVEHIRKTMQADRKKIGVRDFGAGSHTGMRRNRSIRDIARFTTVSRKYGQVLARLVRILHPCTVVELGTGTGLSAMYMGLSDPDVKILTCEGSDAVAEIARLNLRTAGVSNVKIFTGMFETLLPDMLNQADDELLLFMDGDHREESIWSVFSRIMDSGRSPGTMVFDDINWSPAMKRGWDRMKEHPGISLSVETFRMGIIMFGKPVGREHFTVHF